MEPENDHIVMAELLAFDLCNSADNISVWMTNVLAVFFKLTSPYNLQIDKN